jgi:hypothetical protein
VLERFYMRRLSADVTGTIAAHLLCCESCSAYLRDTDRLLTVLRQYVLEANLEDDVIDERPTAVDGRYERGSSAAIAMT